jgi:V8-like Glu-specific endopeptidase
VRGWVENKSEGTDYGAVILPEPLPGPHLVCAPLEDDQLFSQVVHLSGYPADKPTGTLWRHDRLVRDVQPRRLLYDLFTFGGMSGAPVFQGEGDAVRVIAMHIGGDLAGNAALRVTPAVVANVQAWGSEK